MRPVPLALASFFATTALCVGTAAAQSTPLVYVRCARTDVTVDLTLDVTIDGTTRAVTRTMRGLDVYDVLPDVTHFFSGFNAPCDLMHRAADGTERVLYDCSSTSTDEASCAAMDPAVSFDGATVAFTVFRGPLSAGSEPVHPQVIDPRAAPGPAVRLPLPNRTLAATEAQLHLVDVATGEVRALPHEPETFDAGPAFLPNGRLAFTSSRDGNTTTLVFGTNSSGRGSRLYAMDLDGRNVDLSSHHSLAQEQHPIVLRDGRLALTSWQIFGGLPFRHTNGSPGGFTTIGNLFHLYTQHPDGALPFAFYGQHAGDHTPLTSTGVDHKAAHFLTQTSDGRVWFTDYYRGNNNGLGVVIGVMPEPDGQEGFGPDEIMARGDLYAPRDVQRLTRWATSSDNMASPMREPPLSVPTYADPLPFAGKVGHPSALPDGGLLVTWGKGACSTVSGSGIFTALGREVPPLTSGSGSGTAMNVITSLEMDTPGCDAGLYRVTTFPSMHPSDLELVVDSREWHEIQARALVPYAEIHGVERPATIDPADVRASHSALEVGTPFGLLGAASILDRETHPHGGILFQGEHQFHNQGTDTIDYTDDDLCGVRILGVMPNRNRNTYQELANVAGERVRILGEIPVRHRLPDGSPRMDPSGHADTSFLVRMPANVPYLMQGIDCDGRTLNTDQTWQSLRPGEQKTCGGCHVHSRATRIVFEESFAATDEYAIPELGMGSVPLLAGRSDDGTIATREVSGDGLAIDFEADVLPIFERRCNDCHGGDAPAAGLALDRPGTDRDTQSTWFCLVADRSQSCVPEASRHLTGAGGSGTTFRRPQLTRYLRAFNALSSLLYWKAAGARTDGRTDATYGDADRPEVRDIDFGVAHETEITDEELGVLARWIDIGAAGGPMERRDTQRPTLHLAATVDGDRVTALHVGTVDLGEGVDVGSLELCVLEGDACATDLSVPADAHGVVRVTLDAPLSDPEVEVRARVSDLAGNETIVRRTVAWLLRAPPPPPPRPDGGPSVDGGMRSDGGDEPSEMSGGCGCRTTSASDGAFVLVGLAAWLRRRRAVRGSSPDRSSR